MFKHQMSMAVFEGENLKDIKRAFEEFFATVPLYTHHSTSVVQRDDRKTIEVAVVYTAPVEE